MVEEGTGSGDRPVLSYEARQEATAWDGRPPMHRLASSALTLGAMGCLLSFVAGLGAILGVVAIGQGVVALRDIARNPSVLRGTEQAVVGMVMGCIAMGAGTLFAVVLLAELLHR